MKTHQRKHRFNGQKVIIIAVALAFVLVASAGYLLIAKRNGWLLPFVTEKSNGSTELPMEGRSVNDIDYSGPSVTDTIESQEGKKKNNTSTSSPKKPSKISSSSTPKVSASIAVSFADISGENFEVRAFVTTAIEGGGTCTATLTKGEYKLEQSSEAFIDTSSSQCHPIYIPLSNFPSRGTWNINITYSSETHRGESGLFEVTL